jgi:hypothetical protein
MGDTARTDTAPIDTAPTDTAPTDTALTDADAAGLARALTALLDTARHRIGTGTRSALVERVTGHVGAPLEQIPNVALTRPSWEHVTLHVAVAAYLAEHSPDAEWFGVGGAHREHSDLVDLLSGAEQHGMYQLGAVDYTTLAAGPDRVVDAVQLGFVPTSAPGGAPVVLALRGGVAEYGRPSCELRVLAADRAAAAAVRDEVERLVREHDVFRGQVLSFDLNEHQGNEMVSFLPRVPLSRDDVVLPDGVLDAIEQHVVRSAGVSEELRRLGQHLKRGVLLHGPPGTGKTHTVRYLIGRMERSTVVVLSGRALAKLDRAAALARRLTPSVLVIEDVDLIAEDRSHHEATPLLFELLNRIDGVDADADVTFVLTTNRVAEMERALVDRPGRVDLAVEVPRPDAVARERLLRLYARDVPLDEAAVAPTVAATDGVTASFVRELVRRTVLRALAGGSEPALTAELLAATVADLTGERSQLTRALLGG